MSLIGGILAGAIGSAVSSALKNSNKNKGTSGSSSGNSSAVRGSSTTSGGGTSKPSYSYDADIDYQAEIDKAVARGDYAKAAVYEQQRNQKILDLGLDYNTSNKYASYLPGTQYSESGVQNYGGGKTSSATITYPTTIYSGKGSSGSIQAGGIVDNGHPVINWNPNEAPVYGKNYENVDWQALIDEAVDNGNLGLAAQYEQNRNNKIDAQGLNYGKTYNYVDYLGTPTKGIADLWDAENGTFHITADDPNSRNTGAGKDVTEADGMWLDGSAGYNQNFQQYMNDMAARIAVYEASDDPVLHRHLPGMYNAMANYENQRNAKLVAMGRPDLVTNNWQDYSHSTKGWEKDINDVGNGAALLSAEQIAGYEQIAAKLQNAFDQATNDYAREEIWKDLASYNLMLGRAWDADTRQWSASTVSPIKDYYGESGGEYSYGSLTNGTLQDEASRALAQSLQQARREARDNYGADGVNWYENPESLLAGKPRIAANANAFPNLNGKTITDYQVEYELAKQRGDTAAMNAAHEAAEAIRRQMGYSGGADGSEYIRLDGGTSGTGSGTAGGGTTTSKLDAALSLPGFGGTNLPTQVMTNALSGVLSETLGGMLSGQQQGQMMMPELQMPELMGDEYLQEYYNQMAATEGYLNQAAQSAQDAIYAGVENAVASLNSQRGTIEQAEQAANQAAQQIYMDTINPNGATAEQLAALGLRTSGLTESSVISAGNSLQQSVNANAQNTTNQLAQIDLAITQARNSGDIAAAQALEQYYAQIASQQAAQAQAVLAYRQQQAAQQLALQQWMYEQQWNQQMFGYTQQQDAFNQQLQLAQLQMAQEQAAWDKQYAQNQMDWANKQYSSDKAYDTVMQALALGSLPSHNMIVAAGLNDADVYSMWQSVRRQMGLA